MKYSFRVVIGKFIICSSILLLCFIGMILAAIITKLTFVALAWFQSGILKFCGAILFMLLSWVVWGHIRFLLGFVISFRAKGFS